MLLSPILLSSTLVVASPLFHNGTTAGLAKRVDGTCKVYPQALEWSYVVTTPGDGQSGGPCGQSQGFLDNLNGYWLVISGFQCVAESNNTGTVTFSTTIDTSSQVNGAFKSAYKGACGC